jgi:peptide/nickel transport system substrate-binding protein/oligopeptide transport system substrate-binding protein
MVGGAPKAESLRARIIAEPSTAVAEFESGNVSILRVPPSEARDWTENVASQSKRRLSPPPPRDRRLPDL